MLPEMPDRDDINFGFYYRSASGVSRLGGDFYDLIDLPDGRLAVLVGDVCGQGLEAATSTAMMKYTVRAYLQADPDPSLCLTRLNQAVMNQLSLDKFVTLSLAVIDPARQQADYASAGHPPALLVRSPKASLVELGRTIPIGVVDNYNYTNKSISLSGACSLALYTDGLIEARPPGGDPFGHERLLAAASSRSCLAPQQLVKALSHRVDVYSQSNLNDDICLLVVQLPPART